MNGERVLRKVTGPGLRAIAGLGEGSPSPASSQGPRCPWVGVPLPGKRPALVVHRERLQAVLQGIKIDGVSVTTGPENDNRYRLKIWGHTPGRGNGRRGTLCNYILYDIRNNLGFYKFPSLGLTIRDWAEHVKAARAQAVARALVPPEERSRNYRERRIAAARERLLQGIKKQERAIEKHKRVTGSWRPRGVFLPRDTPREQTREARERELRWHLEKPGRRKLGWAVVQIRERFTTNRERYAALEALGYTVKKWGDATPTHWEYHGFGCVGDYWKWLFTVQGSGLQERKPWRDSITGMYQRERNWHYPTQLAEASALQERLARHRKDLEEHAGWLREHKSLEMTLEALQDELRAFDEGNGPGGPEYRCTACGSVLEAMPGAAGAVGWCPSCETDVKRRGHYTRRRRRWEHAD